MGYFKDISEMLAKRYPDRRVFVISDEHFYHKNIIAATRSSQFDPNDDNSIEKMNDYIIEEHNKTVGEDDIVLILGDFTFKPEISHLKEILSKLNGHKFLVMGNHDKIERPEVYIKAGFEDVFISPVKFNGDYYSHYPLNASKDTDDRPNTHLYNKLFEEFSNSNSGINFHGHQHIEVNNGPREKNVATEVIGYKPLFVGRTKSYQSIESPQFINDDFFEVLHELMRQYNYLQKNNLMTDYLYSIILELLSKYGDQIVAFGSVLLNKKYGTSFSPSDLDVTKLYDPSKSI